jgi:hypothetical protein
MQVSTKGRSSHPWFKELHVKLRARVSRSEAIWRKSKSANDRILYCSLRNKYFATLDEAYANFMKHEIARYSKDPRGLWEKLALVTGDSLKIARKRMTNVGASSLLSSPM